MLQQQLEPISEGCDEDEIDVRLEGPGIMVFSPVLELLHMNRRAVRLISELSSAPASAQRSLSVADILPPPLSYLAGKIVGMLRERDEAGDRTQCAISYLAATVTTQVLIRCLGLPSGDGSEETRIVFVLTENRDLVKNVTPPALAAEVA